MKGPPTMSDTNPPTYARPIPKEPGALVPKVGDVVVYDNADQGVVTCVSGWYITLRLHGGGKAICPASKCKLIRGAPDLTTDEGRIEVLKALDTIIPNTLMAELPALLTLREDLAGSTTE